MSDFIDRNLAEARLRFCKVSMIGLNDDNVRDIAMAVFDLAISVIHENVPAADVQPKSQWISVDDSLPEEHKCVLVCEDGRVCTAWIHKGEWDALGTVTHWQPLPEPLKEE